MKLSLPVRLKIFSLILLTAIGIGSSFNAGKAYAVNAFPPPGRIPCDVEEDPEYSSDRPYQASPCGDRPITYFCGNTVVVDLGTVSTPYCDPQNGVKTECEFHGGNRPGDDTSMDQSVVVDLTNVQLPILGNTQITLNSQNPTDMIDDPTKMDNFVAWYLNGTNDKAEYPATDTTTREGVSQVVDTSGPIKKLLPSAIQDFARINTINSASELVTYTVDPDGSITPPQTVTEPENHNQIVVCTTHNVFGINNPWIGSEIPIPCYKGDGSPTQGTAYRLKDWSDGSLSIFNTFFNFLGATKWNYKYPPLPWQFVSNLYYQKAYYEWRGSTCIIVPIVNTLACEQIPILSPDRKWSDLYPYVPLANTTDKKGAQMITNTHISASKATLTATSYEIIHSPQLYLAHSLENFSLTNTLKGTYLPSSVSSPNSEGYPGATIPSDVEDNSTACRIIDSRTNPGDYATFTTPKSLISVDVHYTISMIQCSTPTQTCHSNPIPGGPDICGNWHATCKSEVFATIPSISKTPYADEIWKNTVSASDSIFRRIYPKTGAGSPISCIADTPAVSPATYTMDTTEPTLYDKSGITLVKVTEPDGTTTFTGSPTQIDAQLYFPHYGGVLDYFLKGIQTALRPQGFAEPQPANGQYCTNIVCGELPTLPKGTGSCSLGGISSRIGSIPQSLKDIVEAAAQTYKTPPNLILAQMFGEGLFNPGRFNWTDANVKNWATCVKIPGCSETGTDFFMGFNGSVFQTIVPHIQADIQALDPSRTTFSQCNLLDAIYAAAWNLHDSADGGGGLPAQCYGIDLHASVPGSCSWNDNQYEDAIKVYESGYTNICMTAPGGCARGGLAAACPSGDTCEHLGGSGNTSHNACVFDVAHGN